MTLAARLVDVPIDRVVALHGVDVHTVALTVATDHTGLAAVVLDRGVMLDWQMHPLRPADVVTAALNHLERVAVQLLPAWLPDATGISRPDAAGAAAVRMAATTHARDAHYPVAFLADLAEFALTGQRRARPALPARTRGTGLARIVAKGFDRRRIVLLIPLAGGLTAAEQDAVVAGAEWLCAHTPMGVWLLGAPLTAVDRVPVVWLRPPLPTPSATTSASSSAIGSPHPGSAVEARLEAALAVQSWAVGRVWNQTYQSTALTIPFRLDLLWPEERCVVELDGPEHCQPEHFENDRQRDVQLVLDGYAVLRFTNDRVRHDVGAVVHQIGTYLHGRRRDMTKGNHHGRR